MKVEQLLKFHQVIRLNLHTDERYNVMKVTDADGNVVEGYEYEDYGQPSFFDATGKPMTQSAVENPYLFTGRRYDSDNIFYYYRTRYLDPRSGRFTTRDTIGIWVDPSNLGNGYSYVGDNPAKWVDPYGLFVIEPVAPGKFPGPSVCEKVAEKAEGEKKCSPCPEPPPPIIHQVPPHKPHYPCPGDHEHYFEYHQAPWPKCTCRLVKKTRCL